MVLFYSAKMIKFQRIKLEMNTIFSIVGIYKELNNKVKYFRTAECIISSINLVTSVRNGRSKLLDLYRDVPGFSNRKRYEKQVMHCVQLVHINV